MLDQLLAQHVSFEVVQQDVPTVTAPLRLVGRVPKAAAGAWRSMIESLLVAQVANNWVLDISQHWQFREGKFGYFWRIVVGPQHVQAVEKFVQAIPLQAQITGVGVIDLATTGQDRNSSRVFAAGDRGGPPAAPVRTRDRV